MNDHAVKRDFEQHIGRTIENEKRSDRGKRAERESAAEWSAWAASVVDRIDAIERRVCMFFGSGGEDDNFDPVVAELGRDISKCASAEQLTAVAASLREEAQIELAVCRDEILSRVDALQFGQARDFDPDLVMRAVGELRKELTRRAEVTNARFDALATQIEKLEATRRTLLIKVAEVHHRLRALPAPPPTIASWQLDAQGYSATPTMSDGSLGAKLELRVLFEQYHADAKG